jgi:quercetin dioxygenase-like cupin family protein
MPIIHEDDVAYKQLPGRKHRMVLTPDSVGSRQMTFGTAVFPAHSKAPGHTHQAEEEIIYVLSGGGEISFDGAPERIRAGSCIFIPPGVEHQIVVDSDEDMKIAYVFSPPTSPAAYDRAPGGGA